MTFQLSKDEIDYCERVVCLGNAANKHVTIGCVKTAVEEGIPGDMAECGVLSGGHPALMAYALGKCQPNKRRVHLYDSFEGVPQAGLNDEPDHQKIHGINPDRYKGIPSGRCIGTMEQVTFNMKVWGVEQRRLVYHPGWLQEVLPKEEAPQLAVLRIDVDFHDSTLPIMEHLYPKMQSGAFIISDDWGAPACRKAVLKYLDKEPTVTPVPGQVTTVYWRKP